MQANFSDVTPLSSLIETNELFDLYFNSQFSFRYDSNFIQLKFSPSIDEFQLLEGIHMAHTDQHGLGHVKFYWPQNSAIDRDILTYFDTYHYLLESLELYQVDPKDFTGKKNPEVTVEKVTPKTFQIFKDLSFEEDKKISQNFAKQKISLYQYLMNRNKTQLYLAHLNGKYVGAITLHESDHFFEIDDFFVVEGFRNQRIGTSIQEYIMRLANENTKEVIVLADAQESPREMYLKQGYHYIGTRTGALCTKDNF